MFEFLLGSYSCLPNEWACPISGRCIPNSKVCDSNSDCPNEDDEGDGCSEYLFIHIDSVNIMFMIDLKKKNFFLM